MGGIMPGGGDGADRCKTATNQGFTTQIPRTTPTRSHFSGSRTYIYPCYERWENWFDSWHMIFKYLNI